MWKRPEWLARFALWQISDYTFTLRNPRVEASEVGYRGNAATAPQFPELPEGIELPDAVLVAQGGRIMVRRVFDFGFRRSFWIALIEVERVRDTITLRARHVFVPMSLLVAWPLFSSWATHSPIFSMHFLGIVAAVVVLLAIQLAFSTTSRNTAIAVAYAAIDMHFRAALEKE